MKNKKLILSILVIIIIVGIILACIKFLGHKKEDKPVNNEPITNQGKNYNSLLIKEVNKINENKNYLISPYSIEIALNLLKEATNNNSREEIIKAVPNRKINLINTNKVKVSNASFIKTKYHDLVTKTFTNHLKDNYNAEIIYDEFSTPDPINNWVKEKTNGMIPKIVDEIDPNFMMGVFNAVALELEFKDKFDCTSTYKTRFTKSDGLHMDVYMMRKKYENSDATYVKKDDYEAVSISYKNDDENHYSFEFIGIKVDDINKFINSLDDNKIKNIMNDGIVASEENNIELKLPRFSYNYSLDTNNFIKVLNNLGIKEAFSKNVDLTGFINEEDIKKYNIEPEISEAIHKTYIDVNEDGTRAAAVTGFLYNDKSAMPLNEKIYSITFDEPFIYMIREKITGEILFFGTVYEPTIWNGNTCQMVD